MELLNLDQQQVNHIVLVPIEVPCQNSAAIIITIPFLSIILFWHVIFLSEIG